MNLLSDHHTLLTIEQWYSLAKQHGLAEEVSKAIDTGINTISPCVIDAQRLVYLLAEGLTSETAILNARWKIQGTDGVRGVVVKSGYTDKEAFIAFTTRNELTPEFCRVYCESFIDTLFDACNNTFPAVIALAEDGRDYYCNTQLKKYIINGIQEYGIGVHDLGIAPTPVLAHYSRDHALPAIMITASHNPSQYNGIKLFIDGVKLYPEGDLGEYMLTWHIVKRIFLPKLYIRKKTSSFITKFTEEEIQELSFKQIINILEQYNLGCNFKKTAILLDAAHGAYSKFAQKICEHLGFTIYPYACTPNGKNINEDCGVGVLEEGRDHYYHNDDHLPCIVKKLFSLEESVAYAIVLDGDGDRSFILTYNKEQQLVTRYDGDQMAYLAAHVIKKQTKFHNPLCRTTIESDFSLLSALEDACGWKGDTVVVGDRWLSKSSSEEQTVILGSEKSGHMIFPLIDQWGKVSYIGNGIASALLVMQALIQEKAQGYPAGTMIRSSFKTANKEIFYRNSPLWIAIDTLVHNVLPYTLLEIVFSDEKDMLYYHLYNAQNTLVGRWYIRKSGTEPKISMSLSIGNETHKESTTYMQELVSDINSLLQIKNMAS